MGLYRIDRGRLFTESRTSRFILTSKTTLQGFSCAIAVDSSWSMFRLIASKRRQSTRVCGGWLRSSDVIGPRMSWSLLSYPAKLLLVHGFAC